MPGSERRREIKRRRHRREKVRSLKARAKKASPSEKAVIAEKLRALTPGGDVIVKELQLEK